MAMEHANSFVERMFENDEFLKAIMIKRGFTKGERLNEEKENEKMVKIANEMDFKFDIDEYKEACKEYMKNIDGLEAAQRIFHMLKIITMLYNEKDYDY